MRSKETSNEIAIKVEHVGKTFEPQSSSRTLKEGFVGLGRKLTGKKPSKHHKGEYTALKDISFEVKKGEFFGIVGRNGSGKSTLLKIIAGVYTPTKGGVQINGKLTPFIELGVGFNPELSGKDNVYLNAALLGFTRNQTEEMYDDIVNFSELHDFMDTKLKNYSSGMQVRLAFSVAIRADSDILLLDEVLAVGDEAFQRKCNGYFYELKKRKKTVVLVTHNMDAVKKYCNKAMMINDGKVVTYGSAEDVSNEYSIENLEVNNPNNKEVEKKDKKTEQVKDLNVVVPTGKLIDENGKVRVDVSYTSLISKPTKIRVSFFDIDRNTPIFATSSKLYKSKDVVASLSTTLGFLNDTNFKVSVSIQNEENETLHFLPDEKAPKVILKRTDYPNPKKKNTWAIMFNRGEWL